MNKVWADEKSADVFAPFTVGMWIGESSSPNKFFSNPRFSGSTTVQDIFDLHTRNEQLPESTFIQFTTCPWCGDESIGEVDNWEIDEVHSNGRIMPKLKGSCSNQECQFHDSIPFSCVDEDLYLHPPTILLGTVDKMVQLAHNNFAKSVKYGKMSNGDPFTVYSENNARRMLGFDRSGPLLPDLIIQDELHLLSGPLGSLAGMIEIRFQQLATHRAFTKICCCDCYDQRCRQGYWAHLWSRVECISPTIADCERQFLCQRTIRHTEQSMTNSHGNFSSSKKGKICNRTANSFFAPNRSKSQGKWSRKRCY